MTIRWIPLGVIGGPTSPSFSQTQIGTMTGQSEPEISAILSGRHVIAHTVLARIAHGLGIPPGYLGLACCPCPHATPTPHGTTEGAALAGPAPAHPRSLEHDMDNTV